MANRSSQAGASERQPLLQSSRSNQGNGSDNSHQSRDQRKEQKVEFEDEDSENPRQWALKWKYIQTLQIFVIAFICPMASSIMAPAMTDITSDFNTQNKIALLSQTGFVCMLGIGPLFHAPMSETFGRRIVFLINLALYTLVQIPTALAPNVAAFVAFRTLGGFFGSVGVANGGGSISDLFETHERAVVLGVYLVAPLLGPTIGPLLGGLIVGSFHWRWMFWLTTILGAFATITAYFFLHETRAMTILQQRQKKLEEKDPDTRYIVEGVSDQSIPQKIVGNSTRAIRILTTQPIVMTMSLYQALVFSSMYSLYAQYNSIFSSPPYNFSKTQIGLAYLAPAIGFIFTAVFIVMYIDKLYSYLTEKNSKNDDGESNNDDDDSDEKKGQPEYRLPMANIGAVFLPISLFWFGWTIEKGLNWPVPLIATLFFGASQVSIFNTVQTYYIDAFESQAASALAAGAFMRSMVGGIVPLFVSNLFDSLGYGWGMSVFGILSLILMPAPALFYWYGRTLREKFPFKG